MLYFEVGFFMIRFSVFADILLCLLFRVSEIQRVPSGKSDPFVFDCVWLSAHSEEHSIYISTD